MTAHRSSASKPKWTICAAPRRTVETNSALPYSGNPADMSYSTAITLCSQPSPGQPGVAWCGPFLRDGAACRARRLTDRRLSGHGSWVRSGTGGGCWHARDAQRRLEREQAELEGRAEKGAGQFGEPLGAPGPSTRQGASASRSVRHSISSRPSRPRSVAWPAASIHPRAASRSRAADHSRALQPRLAKTSSGAAPMAASDTSASHGSSPAVINAAMCPSPRCSRKHVDGVPNHQVRLAGPGQVGVGGGERVPGSAGRQRRVTGQFRHFGQAGRADQVAEQCPVHPVDRPFPRRQDLRRRGHRPRGGYVGRHRSATIRRKSPAASRPT